jgi:hypothetical protein
MTDKPKAEEHRLPDVPSQRDDSPYASLNDAPGAPPEVRQSARGESGPGTVARSGGATQSSGGQLDENGEELGTGPGRGAD